ncbi:hypothetical protein IJG28_01325 [Candidatus Saccharibacteria bacterium]|nr:hypothetical protein [Candidatus Saccharibacteria bacterium]
MPEDNTAAPNSTSPLEPITPVLPTVADASSAIVTPSIPDKGSAPKDAADSSTALYPEIASKISDAHNVLVALSSDPSVDEMAAAIGLSIYLDRLGKRATAIYSGTTPNALEFLKPEETFESTADTLQDFVIALNKEKADHLRYKLDGDFVKIYITPFNTRISEEDLEFSYGDFNVDLVLALDVANGIDLDSALREHGRIMHDAVIINITTGNPGKFGEIEWSDKRASSVSEMIAKLLYSVNSKVEIGKEEATAFLTGIVAATNRFSNATTTPETMQVASKLMRSGANQQLISKNITPDIDNQLFSLTVDKISEKKTEDPTKLDIEHDGEEGVDETKEVDANVTEKASTLLDDLKAAEASLATAGAETTPVVDHNTLKIDEDGKESVEGPAVEPAPEPAPEPTLEPAPEPTPESTPEPIASESTASKPITPNPAAPESPIAPEPVPVTTAQSEKVIQPPETLGSDFLSQPEDNKYGHMLEEALEGLSPVEPTAPTFSPAESLSTVPPVASPDFASNPAAMSAPTVPMNPEINGVPEMNYMPMPGEEILPPPPAPAFNSPMPTGAMPTMEPIAPAMPTVEPAPEPLGAQPSMQDQVYAPQASDPSAFKIPGM